MPFSKFKHVPEQFSKVWWFFFEKSTKNINFSKLPYPGCASRFGRANKLILTQNETSIHLNDFEFNRTSNPNAKYQLNFKSDVQCHRCARSQAQSMATSGKPSIWFPLEKLVEQEPSHLSFLIFLLNLNIFRFFEIFQNKNINI